MDQIKIKVVENKKEISEAKEVRRKVFQIEQGIDSKLDFDGKDDSADHIIAYIYSKIAIGTVRLRYLSDKSVKLERLAVIKDYRKIGIGKMIMLYVIQYLKDKGIKRIILDSQEYASKFYEGFGFEKEGGIFEEVGIPHIKMLKEL